MLELCKLAKEKISRENIFAVWKEKRPLALLAFLCYAEITN